MQRVFYVQTTEMTSHWYVENPNTDKHRFSMICLLRYLTIANKQRSRVYFNPINHISHIN